MAVPIFNQALQVFNKDKSKFTIPKKDTDDYKKVVAIMNEIKTKQPTKPKPTTVKKSIKIKEQPLQVSMPSQ